MTNNAENPGPLNSDWERLFAQSGDARLVFALAEPFSVVYANDSARELFGRSAGVLRDYLSSDDYETHFGPRGHIAKWTQAPKVLDMGTRRTLRGVHRSGRELVIQIGLDPIFDHDGNLQYAQLRISQEDVFHRELVAKHRELELQHTAAIKEREQDSRDLQSEHTRQITIIAMILIGVLSIMPLLAGFWMTVDGSDDALVEMGRQLGDRKSVV